MLARLLIGAIIIAQGPAILPVGSFRIEPGDSKIEFVMRDNRGGFTGSTDRVEGTATVRRLDGDVYEAAVDARVDARTLTTGSGMRDGQMRRDFLQTDRFPFITFKGAATARERLSAGPIRAQLRGNLTIREATREVDMPIEVTALAEEFRAAGEVTIRLTEYGIPIPRFLIFVAEDPVVVRLRIRMRRAP
ncbi:MAG: YceI family protein [Armatimonadota bacterium]